LFAGAQTSFAHKALLFLVSAYIEKIGKTGEVMASQSGKDFLRDTSDARSSTQMR